jgi:hypothetical protein
MNPTQKITGTPKTVQTDHDCIQLLVEAKREANKRVQSEFNKVIEMMKGESCCQNSPMPGINKLTPKVLYKNRISNLEEIISFIKKELQPEKVKKLTDFGPFRTVENFYRSRLTSMQSIQAGVRAVKSSSIYDKATSVWTNPNSTPDQNIAASKELISFFNSSAKESAEIRDGILNQLNYGNFIRWLSDQFDSNDEQGINSFNGFICLNSTCVKMLYNASSLHKEWLKNYETMCENQPGIIILRPPHPFQDNVEDFHNFSCLFLNRFIKPEEFEAYVKIFTNKKYQIPQAELSKCEIWFTRYLHGIQTDLMQKGEGYAKGFERLVATHPAWVELGKTFEERGLPLLRLLVKTLINKEVKDIWLGFSRKSIREGKPYSVKSFLEGFSKNICELIQFSRENVANMMLLKRDDTAYLPETIKLFPHIRMVELNFRMLSSQKKNYYL